MHTSLGWLIDEQLLIAAWKPQRRRHLVVWLGACDLSLYDGDVDHSFRWHRYTNCDDPEEKNVNTWRTDKHLLVNCSMWCDNKDAQCFSAILTPILLSPHFILPVLSLHFVVFVKVEYVLHYFFPPGQQESSWRFLLQSQTGEQLRIRLDLHPIHHFRENREHRGDGCDPRVLWETTTTTTTNVHVVRSRYSNLSMILHFCQYPTACYSYSLFQYWHWNTTMYVCSWYRALPIYQQTNIGLSSV